MRTRSLWRTNSRRLTLLLLVIAVPPAATLVWLAVLLLGQERSLLAQRDLELRQVAMQSAIRSMEQSLARPERRSSVDVWAVENVLPPSPPTAGAARR